MELEAHTLGIEATDHEIRSPKYGLLIPSTTVTRERDHQSAVRAKSENPANRFFFPVQISRISGRLEVFVCQSGTLQAPFGA